MDDAEHRAPAEQAIARSIVDGSGIGKPLSRRSMQRQRSVESYLYGEMLPRYMQRAAQIEQLTQTHAVALRSAHRRLRFEHRRDPEALAAAWTAELEGWDFSSVNELIRQHNEYYPIERDLAMDPQTGDYVLVSGRPYRRAELGPAWARSVVEP